MGYSMIPDRGPLKALKTSPMFGDIRGCRISKNSIKHAISSIVPVASRPRWTSSVVKGRDWPLGTFSNRLRWTLTTAVLVIREQVLSNDCYDALHSFFDFDVRKNRMGTQKLRRVAYVFWNAGFLVGKEG